MNKMFIASAIVAITLLSVVGCDQPKRPIQTNKKSDSAMIGQKVTDSLPRDFEEPDIEVNIDLDAVQRRAKYPEEAKRRKLEGKVVVQVLIDKQGRPRRWRILSSNHKLLNQAAIDAVMQSHFSPPVLNHKDTVEAWIAIPIEFKLH